MILKHWVWAAFLSTACLLICAHPAWADSAYTLVEAETAPQGTIVADSKCSGGKYVHRDGDYQPVIFASLPKEGDSFVIWARVRGEALQLKGVADDGKQTDLNWVYDTPADFTWESFGRHTRKEIGAQALLIKGPGAKDNSGLDAVVFALKDDFDPGKAFPDLKDAAPAPRAAEAPPEDTPVTARIAVNWAVPIARATTWNFGSNDWAITDPQQTADDPMFQSRLADLNISLLRIHNGGLTAAWTDPAAKAWDAAKIQAAYRAPYLRHKTILQNIPVWPSWMKQTDGMLDPSEYDHYARFCAELVDIVNNRLHEHVRYWEPLNEEDTAYAAKGKLDDLWTIYDKCAAAMKANDPSIKVGGAAFTWDDPAKVESFLKHSAPRIDFLTWHRYASGSKDDPTGKIMAETSGFGDSVTTVRALTARYSPHRRIPLALDEFSVDWTYTSQETRQNTIVGAVWFASILKHLTEAGIDMAASWNLKDGFYGLMDGGNTLKPAAQVFAWGNRYLTGSVAKTVSNQAMVEAMAVRQADGTRSVLVINKADGVATILLTGLGNTADMQIRRFDTRGIVFDAGTSARVSNLTMPAYSLLLVRFGDKTLRTARRDP